MEVSLYDSVSGTGLPCRMEVSLYDSVSGAGFPCCMRSVPI